MVTSTTFFVFWPHIVTVVCFINYMKKLFHKMEKRNDAENGKVKKVLETKFIRK